VIRVAIRAARLERPGWQAEMIARLRALPDVDVSETYEPRPLLPADLFIDPTEIAVTGGDSPHPRFGIWRFVYGPEARLGEPCAREHAAGERGVMVRLVALGADGRATVLETGMLKAVAHSLNATRARMFDAIAEWPARTLRRWLANGEPQVRGAPVAISNAPASRAVAKSGVLIQLARRLRQECTEEHWTLGIIRKPIHHVIDRFDAREIEWLVPPEGTVLADPAGAIEHNGRLTILAEAYDFDDRQGRIVALDVQEHRIACAPREVLRQPVHLSYPHLISHDGQCYCVPEMSGLGRVQLFRADPFPDRWVPDRILLGSFAGADATLYRHGGRWWMFAGDHDDQDETKLFLFHATDLFGPWAAHALNPVKCDLRSARPAGPLFEHNGSLYRPAQDGSRTYGGAVAVNRIRVLSPTEFDEETINVLAPDPQGPRPDGLHTLTGVGNATLVDGKRHARSFKRLAWGLKQLAHQRLHPASPTASPRGRQDHGSAPAR
jgi:hypothetical protein